MKKIMILTNKDINNLLRDNGHEYRLIKLLEYDDTSILIINIDQTQHPLINEYTIIDIPGLSFRKYYQLVKKFNINNKTLFIQDSFFRYSINKLIIYVKYKYSLKEILKSFYHVLYAFVNELFISIYFKKIGYVSNDDFFLPVLFKDKYFVVKNGVSISSFDCVQKNINRKQIKLFFWGNMSYAPNRESLLIFIKEYWDVLQESFKNIELHIYGKYNNSLLSKIEDMNTKNIFLDGRFDTHKSLFESNDIFINFIQFGAGIKNKTLEALAHEVPMVCSHHSLEGINEINQYKYTYSNINELIESINLIIDNFDLQNAQKNSKLVRETYTWEKAYFNYIQKVKA